MWKAVKGDEMVGLMICDLPGQDAPEAYVSGMQYTKIGSVRSTKVD